MARMKKPAYKQGNHNILHKPPCIPNHFTSLVYLTLPVDFVNYKKALKHFFFPTYTSQTCIYLQQGFRLTQVTDLLTLVVPLSYLYYMF